MSKVGLIQHKGKDIYYLDFSERMNRTEIVDEIEDVKKYVITQPLGSVLFLTNVSNTAYNGDVAEAFRLLAEHNKPYARASAVVGITGLKKFTFEMIIKLTGRKIVVFDDIEKAKDWLTGLN